MARPLRLKRLLKRHPKLVEALEQLALEAGSALTLEDLDGTVAHRCNPSTTEPDTGALRAPIVVDEDTIGTAVGPSCTTATALIAAVGSQAQLNQAMGQEVLQLYRQQSATAALAELLSETSEPDVVANMVTDAVSRAVPDASVAFIDDSGRLLSNTGQPAAFDLQLRPNEPLIRNDGHNYILGAPVVGAAQRFGHLQTHRDIEEFTAAEAELLGTFGVIAGAAMGRAMAHQRDLKMARQRSQELEITVARLQSELDLVTHRVLASVLFTDLVNSTQSQASVGDAAWARLIETHNRQATKLVEGHGGTVIDFAGDGVFAWFETPSQAVECGQRHLEGVEQLGLQCRAGVHVGEAEQRGSALSGLAVNTAARIMGEAGAGQLFVSSVTADLLQASELRFEWVGDVELKGLSAPQRVLSLIRSDTPRSPS